MKIEFSKIIVVLIFLSLIAGCATEEKINENQICTRNAFERFPIKSASQNYTELEYFQRQEGMTCTRIPSGFYNAGGVECEPNMRTYQRQVQKTRLVDGNEALRNDFINKCTNRQCLIKYGNSECKK
jgi:hypothetical protein